MRGQNKKKMDISVRLEQLREIMAKEKVGAYMVPTSDFHNSEYISDYFKVREFLSGFTGSNGTLLVTAREALLWTDGRYFIQAQQELAGTEIILMRMGEPEVPTIAEYLKKKFTEGEGIPARLAFDGRVTGYQYGRQLECKLAEIPVEIMYDSDFAGEIWKERPSLPAAPVFSLPAEYAGESTEAKLRQVRVEIKEQNCDTFILSKLDDLMWLFNIRGGDVACNPVALSYGIITLEEAFLFIRTECVPVEVKTFLEEQKVNLRPYEDFFEAVKQLPKQAEIVSSYKDINYALGKLLEERKSVNAPNITEMLKAVKSAVELTHIRETCIADSVCVTKFMYWLKSASANHSQNTADKQPTERTAAAYLDHLRRQTAGFLDFSFPTISAYKENAAMMHYEATKESDKILQAEGMLLVDSGGQYMGGTTDVTRTIVLGEISPAEKEHFTAVVKGMLRLANATFLHGCTGRNLDILARQPLWERLVDYKSGTGHGVGYMLNVHEGPHAIRWKSVQGVPDAVLEPGMVVTDEPGVYIEGCYGIRIENELLCKEQEKNEHGCFLSFEILTYVPIDLDGIDSLLLDESERRMLNQYHQAVYDKIAPYLDKEEQEWLKYATRAIS